MQTLVDGVELFCGLTGHKIKTKEPHALILCWLGDETAPGTDWVDVMLKSE
jgi:hypothetical protein